MLPMPVKTTVLRLERQIREEHLRALDVARLTFEKLAGEVVAAARRRGFAGDDPYLALQTLCAADPDQRRLGKAVGELWLTFFGCLDPHGGADVATFRTAADVLNRRLAQVPPGEGPDPALAADVVESLDAFWHTHQQMVAAQLARLAGSTGAQAARELQAALAAERTRAEAADSGRQAIIAAFAEFLAAVNAAAENREHPPLPGQAQQVVAAVRRVGAARAELAAELTELRTQVAQLSGERRQLLEEIAARDARIARVESGVPADLDLDAATAAQAVRACDRHLDQLTRLLGDLRRVVPLGEDPRRYRPRLFGGHYEFKTLPGQAAALRDAARDVLAFADRARWSMGVKRLAQAVPKLEKVFAELVRLIAAWRAKLGDPPPVSATMAINAADSAVALPAVAAADVEALLRRRGAGEKAAAELAPLLESCAALLHRTVAQARGVDIPRTEPKGKEAPKAQAMRLAKELSELAGLCETAFAEVVAQSFALPAAETQLLADDQLVRLALQQLDGACAELAALPGAPAAELAVLPARGDRDAALAAARSRADWLERMAACRFRVV
jgi:hypothetical protein